MPLQPRTAAAPLHRNGGHGASSRRRRRNHTAIPMPASDAAPIDEPGHGGPNCRTAAKPQGNGPQAGDAAGQAITKVWTRTGRMWRRAKTRPKLAEANLPRGATGGGKNLMRFVLKGYVNSISGCPDRCWLAAGCRRPHACDANRGEVRRVRPASRCVSCGGRRRGAVGVWEQSASRSGRRRGAVGVEERSALEQQVTR